MIRYVLFIILIISFLLRVYRLDYPNLYVFDEVYHAFTAKEYLRGNREAWNPWAESPSGVAFEWLHPPISKEIMASSMFILQNTNPWAWRLPGVILGTLSIFLVYKLAQLLFASRITALLSAFIFSIDGLNFVGSRTGMNDIYLVTFTLLSLLFFLKKQFFWASIMMGIACATKWSGVFLFPIYIILLFQQKQYNKLVYFVFIPPIIYFLSYIPYFLQGYNFSNFLELHKQIWWYQTNLKASHDYASPWWSWPLNLYPVWYYVEYQGEQIANIFASGNPIVFWSGSVAIILTGWEVIRGYILRVKREVSLFVIILGFLAFLLPWAISPRIMFLYHFSPSVPFLSLALGYQLRHLWHKKLPMLIFLLTLMTISFLLIYPFLVGIPIPKNLVQLFFLTNLTKNPF